MQDAWRAYLELALGLTEASRKKAAQIIRSVAEQSGSKVEDLQGMAEELLSQGMANRENVVKLIQFELDKALATVGLATKEEVEDLKSRLRKLEEELREARKQTTDEVAEATPTAKTAKAAKKTVKKTTAKTAAKKTTAKKTTAKKAVKKTAKKTAKKAAKGE